MKRLLVLTVMSLTVFAGCARHYTITLNNGERFTAIGKPHRKGPDFVFKDAKGQPASISAGRVREIAPSSMASSSESSGFKVRTTQ